MVMIRPPVRWCIYDLVKWETNGLPCVSSWNLRPHFGSTSTPIQYYVDLMKAGYRVCPSIRLLFSAASESFISADNPDNADDMEAQIAAEDWTLLATYNLPVCLRCDNCINVMIQPRYEMPIELASIPDSPVVWSSDDAAGSTNLDTESAVDMHGPLDNFASEGQLWGSSPYVDRLQELLPNASWVTIVDNNEGSDDRLGRYVDDGPPTTRDYFGNIEKIWKTSSTMHTLSRRMKDRVAALLAIDPGGTGVAYAENYWPEHWQLRTDQLNAMFNTFEAELGAKWRNRIRWVGYGADEAFRRETIYENGQGYYPSLNYYDSSSSSWYIGIRNRDFTSPDHIRLFDFIPGWKYHKSTNPRLHRELSLWMTPANTFYGKQNGLHEFMSPALYQCWVEWVLWSMRDSGEPFLLRHFESASTVLNVTAFYNQAQKDILAGLGVVGYDNLLYQDYFLPIVNAVQRICEHPILRRYWINGTPILNTTDNPNRAETWSTGFPRPGDDDDSWRYLDCSTNLISSDWDWDSDDGWNAVVTTWAVATLIGSTCLLYVWSPSIQTGTCTVTIPGFGDVTIDKPSVGFAYYTVTGTTPTRIL